MAKKVLSTVWKWVLALFVLAIVMGGAWIVLFNYADCDTRACFDVSLEDCSRATYIGGDNMIYEYVIFGESGGLCDVSVRLLQGELNNRESFILEGREMECSLPLGVIMNPESDLGNCHGLLKEGQQDLIIQKLHTYLVQNLGQINLEVLDVPISSE